MLAAKCQRAVHLESDRFFRFIQAGAIEPWKPESHEQNTIVMHAVAQAAAAYAKAGYFTIIDGIIIPGWFFEPLRDCLARRRPPGRLRGVARAAGRLHRESLGARIRPSLRRRCDRAAVALVRGPRPA